MNRNQALFELSELSSHIETLISEIHAGRYDENGDLSYAVGLGHLMDHISLAWHYSRMSDDEVFALTQEQFEALTVAIPKFQYNCRLVELYEKVI